MLAFDGVALSPAKLAGMKLKRAALPDTDLDGVDLSGANLAAADLGHAFLREPGCAGVRSRMPTSRARSYKVAITVQTPASPRGSWPTSRAR